MWTTIFKPKILDLLNVCSCLIGLIMSNLNWSANQFWTKLVIVNKTWGIDCKIIPLWPTVVVAVAVVAVVGGIIDPTRNDSKLTIEMLLQKSIKSKRLWSETKNSKRRQNISFNIFSCRVKSRGGVGGSPGLGVKRGDS